jgi:4-hydroxy-tetrahydrodipicolinate synthase
MFSGSIVALVTPFTEEGGIDHAAVDRLVDFHLQQGSDGLVVAGTTGESAALTRTEWRELLAAVVRRVDGAVPVLAGTGSAATATAIDLTLQAGDLGADGALVVTPYYVRPGQAGLEAHFTAVADGSSIPVVLYNVPSRTAVDLLPETTARLASHPRIAGIKEAKREPGRIEDLIERCGPGFAVLSGDDPSCLAAMHAGAGGVVSVAANVAPAMMHELCVLAGGQDREAARLLDGRLQHLFDALAVESNPIPVKWALFEMGWIGPQIRLPLTQLDETHRGPLRQCLDGLGLARART